MKLEDVINKYQSIRNKYEDLQKLAGNSKEVYSNLNSARILIDHILLDLGEVKDES